MNNINNTNEIKYSVVRLKEKTAQRLFRYIGERTAEEQGRITADEAINDALDALEEKRRSEVN